MVDTRSGGLLCCFAHTIGLSASECLRYVRNRQTPVYGGGFVVSGYSRGMTDHLALLILAIAAAVGFIALAVGPRPGYHVALILAAAGAVLAMLVVLIQGVTA